MSRIKLAGVAGVLLVGIASLSAITMLRGETQTEIDASNVANDYSKPENWLCRPGQRGACTGFQNVITVAPNGSVSPHHYKADPQAKIDCFYVYPTSSEDRTPNSDMRPGFERDATASQFGQFGSECRQFAPIYRSVTLIALGAEVEGKPMQGTNRDRAYNDVLDAWNYYLAHDNKGRGVVLIGHSQGSQQLVRLIQNEIEGKAIQNQIVSALIPGWTIMVPTGKDVGGTFKSMPLCTHRDQFGCVIAYSSYRANIPPTGKPPGRYGRSKDGMVAACTNPAALGSADRVLLDSYMNTGSMTWTKTETVDTPFVRVPGLISGQCVSRGEYAYLEISVTPDPSDPRTDTIPGDLVVDGKLDPAWGLHVVDVALTMGNLLDLVTQQSNDWLKAHPQQ